MRAVARRHAGARLRRGRPGGGYRFGDYWRLGLPLTIMVLLVGTPLILRAWPLA